MFRIESIKNRIKMEQFSVVEMGLLKKSTVSEEGLNHLPRCKHLSSSDTSLNFNGL